MRVLRSLARARGCFRRPIATIGNFDGVHKGHQVILAQVRRDADQREAAAVALTFDPHPIAVLRPDAAPKRLMTLGDRLSALSECGLDAVVVQRFSRDFAQVAADAFIEQFLVGCLDVGKLVVGHDINFGKGRGGSAGSLVDAGQRHGFAVEVIGPVSAGGVVVHSSAVREAVERGDVRLAHSLLGRPHRVRGRCVHGAGMGRGLGFATVNLRPATEMVPPDGVYVTAAWTGGARVEGVTSIGHRPTFGGASTVIEAHLFDFDRDVYGKVVRLDFLERLRDQRKFESAQSLADQVAADIAAAKRVFAEQRDE